MSKKPILTVHNLDITFTQGFLLQKKTIIQNLSFTLWPGEKVGIFGSNGSGKTTLLKCICGLIHKKKGTILIDKKKLGYVPERYHGPHFLTPKQFMHLIGNLFGIPKKFLDKKIRRLFSLFNLQKYSDEKISNLSKGTSQRLYIAQALLHDPTLLLLDEPFSGLDYNSTQELLAFLEHISNNETTIVCATHTIRPHYFNRILYI